MKEDPKWLLWRQDDNGASTVISRFEKQQDAETKQMELEARGHKQLYWVERSREQTREADASSPAQSTAPEPRLNLVVIRSGDLEISRKFYEAIGLTLTVHRHGNGPEHLASESGESVFEIYPRSSGRGESRGTRLGFLVNSLESTVAALASGGFEISQQPASTEWGMTAVAIDPDGHKVELTESR